MKVRFSSTAEADLEAIGDFIAMGSPDRAVTFIVELRDACRELERYPLRYPQIALGSGRSLRRRLVGSYNILFTVGATQVEVVRVLHGARDLRQLFGDGES